jgi:methionyl-tRNA formyltransferase
VITRIKTWIPEIQKKGHLLNLFYDKEHLVGGDILFLVSCSQKIGPEEIRLYKTALVLHASDLPIGRGWSPHVWAILNGENQIVVSLLEASNTIDCGAIWLKTKFELEGHELLPEINEKLFSAEISLMEHAISHFNEIKPMVQVGEPGPYMVKRRLEDSRLDVNKTIAEQFDLLRVVDSTRFPAHFSFRGKNFLIKIEKYESK